jgi:hypothetical protein
MGVQRRAVRCPEIAPLVPADSRIDYLAEIGSKTWAIEHTLIEAFPDPCATARLLEASSSFELFSLSSVILLALAGIARPFD